MIVINNSVASGETNFATEPECYKSVNVRALIVAECLSEVFQQSQRQCFASSRLQRAVKYLSFVTMANFFMFLAAVVAAVLVSSSSADNIPPKVVCYYDSRSYVRESELLLRILFIHYPSAISCYPVTCYSDLVKSQNLFDRGINKSCNVSTFVYFFINFYCTSIWKSANFNLFSKLYIVFKNILQ